MPRSRLPLILFPVLLIVLVLLMRFGAENTWTEIGTLLGYLFGGLAVFIGFLWGVVTIVRRIQRHRRIRRTGIRIVRRVNHPTIWEILTPVQWRALGGGALLGITAGVIAGFIFT